MPPPQLTQQHGATAGVQGWPPRFGPESAIAKIWPCERVRRRTPLPASKLAGLASGVTSSSVVISISMPSSPTSSRGPENSLMRTSSPEFCGWDQNGASPTATAHTDSLGEAQGAPSLPFAPGSPPSAGFRHTVTFRQSSPIKKRPGSRPGTTPGAGPGRTPAALREGPRPHGCAAAFLSSHRISPGPDMSVHQTRSGARLRGTDPRVFGHLRKGGVEYRPSTFLYSPPAVQSGIAGLNVVGGRLPVARDFADGPRQDAQQRASPQLRSANPCVAGGMSRPDLFPRYLREEVGDARIDAAAAGLAPSQAVTGDSALWRWNIGQGRKLGHGHDEGRHLLSRRMRPATRRNNRPGGQLNSSSDRIVGGWEVSGLAEAGADSLVGFVKDVL